MIDPKTPPTDDEKRQAVADALANIALSVEQYDLKNFQEALDQWHELTHPKPEEK